MTDKDREASYAMVMASWRTQDIADCAHESKLKTPAKRVVGNYKLHITY